MKVDKTDELRLLLTGKFETSAVVDAVLDVWPDHLPYLVRSFEARSPDMLEATEIAASAARRLIAGNEAQFAADYRWVCDRLREEELFFHREGRYRLSTFAEAIAEVYSNNEYMARYINGLLLSQLLWYNHAATFEMFLNRVLAASVEPFDYLEVGPGHGLMVFLAARSPFSRTLEAWDVSEVSLRETGAALDRLEIVRPVSLVETDILRAQKPDRRYDLIVISEVLEHLETPEIALRFLRRAITDNGRIFINVPINSPSPDHLCLLSSPDEVRELIQASGFRVETMELFATQGKRIERALRDRISVSAGVIARPN